MAYNVFGENIDGVEVEFASPKFGHKTDDGRYIVNWEKENQYVDCNGFDKTHVEPNGKYSMDVVLPVGTVLIRYGRPTGRMTAPFGTPYELLSLPYKPETIEYHQYKVVADGVNVKCVVRRGKARKMFDRAGGAIQYMHQTSIAEEIYQGKLEEDFSWMLKKTKNV